jgi:hypothetical protein
MSTEVTFKEVEVTKLNLQPGDVLAVVVKHDDLDNSSLEGLKRALQPAFPKNRIAVFGLSTDDEMKFSILSNPEPEQKLESVGCNTQSYCSDCSCGKKERMEKSES